MEPNQIDQVEQIITPSQIYWIEMADNLDSVLTGMAVAAGFCIVLLLAVRLLWVECVREEVLKNSEEIAKSLDKMMKWTGHFKWLLPLFLFLVLANLFLPTTNQMYRIVGIPMLVNNRLVQHGLPALSKKALQLFTDKLESEKSKEDGK
ncbi:MAG: hypothetical protein J6Y62_04470 [Clostridia bacterium]|nr:hypothetical protein [Clostridia bacterium]